MRRQIVFVILAVLACLAALTGCSRAKANEKDIQVVLEVNGKVQDTVTVNIFNNAVVSEPAATENKVFKGWTRDQNYTKSSTLLTIAGVRTAVEAEANGLTADKPITYYAGIFKQYKVTYVAEEQRIVFLTHSVCGYYLASYIEHFCRVYITSSYIGVNIRYLICIIYFFERHTNLTYKFHSRNIVYTCSYNRVYSYVVKIYIKISDGYLK